jgi:hypothetical protein
MGWLDRIEAELQKRITTTSLLDEIPVCESREHVLHGGQVSEKQLWLLVASHHPGDAVLKLLSHPKGGHNVVPAL